MLHITRIKFRVILNLEDGISLLSAIEAVFLGEVVSHRASVVCREVATGTAVHFTTL
jgi:hypothetical protein